jgi:hypothetical protein
MTRAVALPKLRSKPSRPNSGDERQGAIAAALANRYSFIAVDLHHLLLAGLPAHLCEKCV